MRRLLVLAFIWGWSFLFIKVAVEGLTPATVACARVGLGALVLVLVLRVRRIPLAGALEAWRHCLVAAVFANVVPFTLLAWGEERISSGLTAVLNASTPLFTAIIAALYLKDRLRLLQVAGLLVGFVGVCVAAGLGSGDLANSSIYGSLAAVVAAASYGIAFVYMRRHLIALEPIVAAAGQLTIATALSLPLAIATSVSTGVHLDPHRLVAIVLLGVFGSGIAYVLNYRVIADLGATRASLVTYLIPVVAVTVGILVLDEPFEWRLVAGGILIVGGIALVHLRSPITRKRLTPLLGPTALLVIVALVAIPLVGCGSSSQSGCGKAFKEPIAANLGHVLPNAPDPVYATNPPTSGPHTPGALPGGALTQPLSKPVQVGALEAGNVLIQYRDLDASDVSSLGSLAGDKVVVSPNPTLPDRIVATAWLNKQTCSAVDLAELRGFIRNHEGRGPGTDN